MDGKLQRVARFARENDFTEAQVRYWIAQAQSNGLARAGALVRIGRSVYIRPDGFAKWVEQQQPQNQAA